MKISETTLSRLRTDYRAMFETLRTEVQDWTVKDELGNFSLDLMVERSEHVAKYLFELTRIRMSVRRAYDSAGFEKDLDNKLRISARDFLYELSEDARTLDWICQLWAENMRAIRQLRGREERS